MKKLSCIFGFIICLIVGLIVALPVTASAATYVSGIITTDTTWTPSDSPYIVSGDILVNSGVTLTIEPGVIVKFDGNTGLQIEGTLIAVGTDADNIIFTSSQATPAAGDWGNIFFADSSTDATYDASGNYTGGSILEYCVIEYGGSTDGALLMDDAHPFINYCVIMDNFTGIDADNLTGTLKITNSSISNNTNNASAAIILSGGTAIISDNTISDNINSGINVLSGTATIISGNTVINNSYVGISADSNAATISDNTISDNADNGLQVSGAATILDNTISGNITGIMVVPRDSDFGSTPSTATISGNTISNNTDSGISALSGTATISNNNISNNTADHGAGIYVGDIGNAIISDNTIANNIAVWSGGGIYIAYYSSTKGYSSGTATIINNFITGNSAENASAVDYHSDGGDKDFRNNIITDNTATGTAPTCTVLIKNNPLFNYNDIFNNTATYELWNNNAVDTPNVDARLNWWGTSIEAEIQAKIYDWFDDATKGIIDYYPYLVSPDAEPEPDITVDIESKDFGNVDVLDSLNQIFIISNIGAAALDIGDLYLAGNNPYQFSIYNDNCSGAVIASLGSCTFNAAFSPTKGGALSALIVVNSNDPDTPLLNIGLSGTGVESTPAPDISANPANKDFGSVDVGAGSAVVFTVSNNGSADLEISGASLAGANPDEFAVTGDTCSSAAVAPAESCTIDLVFSPTDAAAMSASLAIISNDPDTPELNIGLSGTGVDIADEYKGKGNGWRNGKN